jgi:predicted nucleotidyltransferase component of viral defense system
MAEQFMRLPESDQAEILIALSHKLKKEPIVLEKDIWVCWTLQALFTMPGRLPMAFKGGTALSKVYNVIERFSEDLDITLDYRGFIDEIKGEHSRSAAKKIGEQLNTRSQIVHCLKMLSNTKSFSTMRHMQTTMTAWLHHSNLYLAAPSLLHSKRTFSKC